MSETTAVATLIRATAQTAGGRRAVRQALADWRGRGLLAAAAAAAAWDATEPGATEWHRWLDRALLALGTALFCAGVIVFFAFNWQALHKFAKFGLIAAALSALAGFAALRPAGDTAARAALAGAQVLAGVLLAVIGQTYQTGADAWQLFALWALLAVPWALAARAAPHWWLVIVVGNVALLRYFSVRLGAGGMLDLLFSARHVRDTTLLLLAATLVQLAAWYVLAASARGAALGLRGVAGPRLLAVLACAHAGWVGLAGLMATPFDGTGLGLAAVALAGLGGWFRLRVFDIVVLSLACLAGIVLAVAGVARVLFDGHGDFGAFLLLALVTIGLAAAAATWLLRAHRAELGERAGGEA